jgi:hypothetical protein
MLRKFGFFFILPGLLALCGCSGGTTAAQQTTKETAAKDSSKPADDVPGLKELDEADRKLAEQQKFCPVNGNLLGTMGKPFKMSVKDRTFFLCCSMCKAEVDKDPDGILKKLDALTAKK